MFSRVVPSSPILELNNLNFFPSSVDNLGLELNEVVDSKPSGSNSNSNGLSDTTAMNHMVNQFYMNHGTQQFASSNYQYTGMPQPEAQVNNAYSMNAFINGTSFLSPPLEEMPGTTTSATTSVTSELDSLNLQFIHPQDVVSFPSIHACTPPMEEFNSRRASLLEMTPAMQSVAAAHHHQPQAQPAQQHMQYHHHHQQLVQSQHGHHQHSTQGQLHQQMMIAPPQLPLPTAEDILSSVETTPLMSDLPHSTLDEVAGIKSEFHENNFDSFSNFTSAHNTQDMNLTHAVVKNEKREEDHGLGSSFEDEYQDEYDEGDMPDLTELKKFRVVRGVSSGGCTTRPPKEAKTSSSSFAKVRLHLASAGIEDVCLPQWNELERTDRRRVIRIERRQNREHIVASFSVVGSAIDHPEPMPAEEGVEFLEVSCLETFVEDKEDEDEDLNNMSFDGCFSDSSDNAELNNGDETILQDDFIEQQQSKQTSQDEYPANGKAQYYITSVEVIRIVELLIGSQPLDAANRRRERGRVRSNLVPFWSRKPVSSKKGRSGSSIPSKDFRIELAQRIMGYEVRKPRGFDKEVRILKWEKLVPALRRALQSYYVEIPESDF